MSINYERKLKHSKNHIKRNFKNNMMSKLDNLKKKNLMF